MHRKKSRIFATFLLVVKGLFLLILDKKKLQVYNVYYGGLNMKKVLLTIFSCVLMLCMATGLVACNEGAHTHTFDDSWTTDQTYHYHKATCEHTELTSDKGEHFFRWTLDVPATTEQTGLKHEECTTCGFKKSENTVIEKQTCEHSLEHIDAVEATCGTEGSIEMWICTSCEKMYAENTGSIEVTALEAIIPKLPHAHDGKWEVDGATHWNKATCEHVGEKVNQGEHVIDESGACIICGVIIDYKVDNRSEWDQILGIFTDVNYTEIITINQYIGPGIDRYTAKNIAYITPTAIELIYDSQSPESYTTYGVIESDGNYTAYYQGKDYGAKIKINQLYYNRSFLDNATIYFSFADNYEKFTYDPETLSYKCSEPISVSYAFHPQGFMCKNIEIKFADRKLAGMSFDYGYAYGESTEIDYFGHCDLVDIGSTVINIPKQLKDLDYGEYYGNIPGDMEELENEVPDISKIKTVALGNNIIDKEDYVFIEFTPEENGDYLITIENSYYVEYEVYDVNWRYLKDMDYETGCVELQAGVTYKIWIMHYYLEDESVEKMTLVVEKGQLPE